MKFTKANFVDDIVSIHYELIRLFVKSCIIYLFGFVIIGSYSVYVMCILAWCEATFWDTAVQLSETMTLECVYPLMDNLTQVEWTKISGTETVNIAVYNPNYHMHINHNYLHRVHFLNSTVGFRNISLSFYNASEADIGTYSCLFHTFPSGLWEKKIKVVQSGKENLIFLFFFYLECLILRNPIKSLQHYSVLSPVPCVDPLMVFSFKE